MRSAFLAAGIALIIVGGLLLLGSETIWMLYYNGPETCTPPNNPFDDVPTCAHIDAEIYILAIAGIICFVVAGTVFFLAKRKATPVMPP